MAVEITGQGVAWSEPYDLAIEDFLDLFDAGRVSDHPGGFNVLFADGSVRFVSDTTDRETVRGMLIRNDGKMAPGSF